MNFAWVGVNLPNLRGLCTINKAIKWQVKKQFTLKKMKTCLHQIVQAVKFLVRILARTINYDYETSFYATFKAKTKTKTTPKIEKCSFDWSSCVLSSWIFKFSPTFKWSENKLFSYGLEKSC